MQKYIDDFLKHLKYERNASPHTLRNYEIDLVQFYDHLAPPDKDGNRRAVPIHQVDNLAIRDFMATLYEQKKKKSSIHRKVAALRTFLSFSTAKASSKTIPPSWSPAPVLIAPCPII